LSNERPYRDLRNVVANYPFESSRGFPGSEPNCGPGDHSRLSCSAGERSSGLGSARIFSKHSARTLAIIRRRREDTNWPRSLSIRTGSAGGKAATPLLSLRWTFRAKRACVVITDTEPDRLAPLAPPAPMGLRGVWVVAARCCAGTIERSVACPSANLRASVKRGLHPSYVRRGSAVGP